MFRLSLVAKITGGKVTPDSVGEIAAQKWFNPVEPRKQVELNAEEIVAMLNHMPGITHIIDPEDILAGKQRSVPINLAYIPFTKCSMRSSASSSWS